MFFKVHVDMYFICYICLYLYLEFAELLKKDMHFRMMLIEI